MKCFLKKLVSTAFIALLTIENMGFYVDASGRYKENIDGYVLTAISEWNFENRKSRVAEIINLKGNSFNGEAIILDCGVYGNVFHNGKDRQYESHHLISNNFPGFLSIIILHSCSYSHSIDLLENVSIVNFP